MVLVPAEDFEVPFPNDPGDLLASGTITSIDLIPWGSNYTFITSIQGDDGALCLGVYKPQRGEAPLRDFPLGTLYKREIAAYELSRQLGWGLVPPTVLREEGPHGVGSMQLYVEPVRDVAGRFEQLRTSHVPDLQRMAVFDLLANNADRKGAHCLLDVRGHLWGIDHGLTFNHVPKLRTVIWDYCGEPIPEPLAADLAGVLEDRTRQEAIRAGLEPYLHGHEMEALFQRWERLVDAPCYPNLDPYRNVPWPPF